VGYRLGITPFTCLTHEEFKAAYIAIAPVAHGTMDRAIVNTSTTDSDHAVANTSTVESDRAITNSSTADFDRVVVNTSTDDTTTIATYPVPPSVVTFKSQGPCGSC
jgi:hypothetical protein